MTNQVFSLKASQRDVSTKAHQLRAKAKLPAVLYGFDVKNTPLTLDFKEFRKVYNQAGGNTLVELEIEGQKPVRVLIHDVQLTKVYDEPAHVDLFAVNLKEKVETEIPLNFVGESPAVEDMEGNLVTNKTEVTVKALPTDLVSEIDVDISVLKTFEDIIRISDLKVPATLEIMDEPEEVVALVNEPRSEEELEAELADTSAEEAELVEGMNKEAEEAAAAKDGEGESEEPAASEETKEE